MNNSLNKILAFTSNPEAAKCCVTVLTFIDGSKSSEDPVTMRNEIEKDKELFSAVHYILGYLDDIAIGIEKGLIDEKLAKLLFGGFLVLVYSGLEPYVKAVREHRGQPKEQFGYRALEGLCRKWKPRAV